MKKRPTPRPDQSGALPFRRKKDGRLRICLIHKPGQGDWGIPKGHIERGETSEETALNEAWEEAGLRGDIVGEPVGTYVYSKWNGTFAVEIHLMEVTGQDATWPEDHFRERHWVKPEVARRRMLGRTFEKPVRDALLRLLGDGGD